jgi:Na+-driven multidrug efflux pump
MQDNNITLWISGAELATNVLLGFWWIQKWGLVGVALANVVAYGVEKVLQMLYLYQRYKIKPAKYLDFRWWLFYSLILLGVYWVQQM